MESHGKLAADSTSLKWMSFDVNRNLRGTQDGKYEVDIKTGILKNCKMTANVEGSVQVMGHDLEGEGRKNLRIIAVQILIYVTH